MIAKKVKSSKNDSKPNKIIILGEKNCGKTSIFSMIFTNIYPSETSYFESTISISKNQIIYSGGELIELDDCGFEENIEGDEDDEYYLRTDIFEKVSTLIYIINTVPEKTNTILNNSNQVYNENIIKRDYNDDSFIKLNKETLFEKCIDLLKEKSPTANVFIFIHKMDKIIKDKRKSIFEEKKREINNIISKYDLKIKIFPTSIWDGSLYIPWTEIMDDMVVNKNKIKKGLKYLLEACDADEIFLFERNTLLCITSVDNGKSVNSEERTKNIPSIIKKLKQALRRIKSCFSRIKLKLNNIMVYLEEFSPFSYIMILSKNPSINYDCIYLNVYILKQKFSQIFNFKLAGI